LPSRGGSASAQAHRARQNERRLAVSQNWQDETSLVFTNEVGEPIEPRTVQREFKQLLKAAGLPTSTRLHDLRHGAASMLLARGRSLREIMELLSHSSIQVTSDIYAHLSDEMKRSNATAMDETFSQARS
jgi:integrase